MHKRISRIIIILAGLFVITLDQVVKFYLSGALQPNSSIPVIKDIFHITLVYNTGAAFGLFKDQPLLFFIGVSAVAITYLIYFLKVVDKAKLFLTLALVLILAGSISNLIDRFRVGCVIDFLDFRVWPVFNLGDSAITVGVLILVLHLFLKRKNASHTC
ncbi:MAG: signal peptidase II [Candidatus Omnitrophica bacterium]|nr:signal peptidase II [Candidatus Omnitrophota bacterium]